ncbi:MAG: helix-hairpin-helix domain-containing protein [Bacteroidota bacterium]
MLSSFKNYLSVTKKEWNGLVVLLILIALVLTAPYIYSLIHKNKAINLKDFNAAVAKLKGTGLADSSENRGILFRFNPNNLPDAQWQKLGLDERKIATIKNYEAKGGRFYSKPDLQKIYAITPEDYRRLAPYITLPEKSNYTEKSNEVVELNTADSAKLTQIRGIGGSFAKLIIRYRDRLGGFYKKEQLKEIIGLDSLTYVDIQPFVKVDAGKIIKINPNKATTNSLIAFPYLTYKQKNAIVEYHTQHGDYAALADLKNIPIIDEVILRKIEPYISFK